MRFISLMPIVFVICINAQCNREKPTMPALSDKQRIQGTWKLISGERHGEKFTDELVKNVQLTFVGDVLRTQNGSDVTEARFTLHPETSPKGMDLDMDGNIGLGIYKLADQTLTILHGEIEEPRPAGFDAVKDGNLSLLVLQKHVE
jgi:uncharacterized protein (TIGR03067 family)